MTFHVNHSTAVNGTSTINLLANSTYLVTGGFAQTFYTTLAGTNANQTFTPSIPNSSLDAGIVLTSSGTSTAVASSNPSVAYGTPVTLTALVSAGTGTVAPTQGSVDFEDTSTNPVTDFGNGTFLSSSGTSSTWTFTTGVTTFNYTTGDTILATYAAGAGFNGSSGTTTQTVAKAGLTITAAANSKNYDGTTSAAATPTVAGLVGSDTVTGLSETYDTPLPGTGKTLTVSSGYVVNDGNSGNNYAVNTVANDSGVINSMEAVSTTTSLTTSSGSVTYGATVTLTAIVSAGTGTDAPAQGSVDFKDTTANTDFGNGTFAGSSGTSSTWTFTTAAKTFNVTTGDTIVATYTAGTGFGNSNGSTTQIVNKAPLTITALPNTKTYDATAVAAATPTVVGLVGSDTVTGLSETYDTKNAGTGKTLTPAGSVNDGNGGDNYAVTLVSNTSGVINQAPLTITAAANTKTYDGTTIAAATPTVAGLMASDTVTGLSETYDTALPGTGKTLTVSSGYVVNDGNGGNNYAVTTAVNNTGVINALPPAKLFLQSMVTNGPQAGVGGTAALMVGGELPVQFTTPAGFLTSGFSGGTFYFAYDTSVFSPVASFSGALTKSLTPAQAAELNLGSNSVLSQSPSTSGFDVAVADKVVSGTIHLVTVTISDAANPASNVTASTGGVLFAINLQPLAATATATKLYLYNSIPLSRTDVIFDGTANVNLYTLGLPGSLTNSAYNATYDFQANVAANTLPTLALGGLMNTGSGQLTPIPSVPTSGGTATVYANILNPDPAGNALYAWTVVLNYDPTQFTVNPTFGTGDLQLGTIETTNGSSNWGATANAQSVSSTDEEVL